MNSLFCRRVHIHALPGMEVDEFIEVSGVNPTAVGFSQLLVLIGGALCHQFADLRQGEKTALFGEFAGLACGWVRVLCHG